MGYCKKPPIKFFRYCRKCDKKFRPNNDEKLCIDCRWEIKRANGRKSKGTKFKRIL